MTMGLYLNGDYIGGYGKLNSVEDVYCYIGSIINDSSVAITFTYLEYYNRIFGTFEEWIEEIKEKKNVIAKYKANGQEYIIKLED